MNYTEDLAKNHSVLSNSSMNADHEDIHLNHLPYSADYTSIWKRLDSVAFMKLTFCLVVIIGGFLGNISVIVTVALKTGKHKISQIYACNLAVADLLICIFCVVPHGVSIVLEDAYLVSEFGEFKCKFIPFVQLTCLAASVFTLSSLAYSRFKAVICPLLTSIKPHNPSLSVLRIWAVASAVASPLLVVKKQYYPENFWQRKCVEEWPFESIFNATDGQCHWKNPLHFCYYLQVSLLLFVVPLMVMTTSYSRIIFKLWTETTPGDDRVVRNKSFIETRIRWTKTIVLMMMTFILSWSLFHGLLMNSAFNCETGILTTKCTDCEWFIYFTAYTNSFYNPFFYMLFCKTFREDVICLWRQGCINEPSQQEVPLVLVNGNEPKSESCSLWDILKKIKRAWQDSCRRRGQNKQAASTSSQINASSAVIQNNDDERVPQEI